MVNGLIKINDEYDVDFSFIDKVLTNMVGIQKNDLLNALRINDIPKPRPPTPPPKPKPKPKIDSQ